jgi:bacillithiol biosynthesis cysteine-adding enzyme BshC
MRHIIKPTKAMGYSDLYLDFLAEKDSARKFYPTASIYDSVANLRRQDFDRKTVAEILERQNKAFGATGRTLENIAQLRDNSDTVCVFSGQQAILLGGPLLVIFKALGAVKAARIYAKQLRRPVIPVFWIAGDDHDFEEVNHTWLLNRQTEPVRISYNSPPDFERATAEIEFTDTEQLDAIKQGIRDTLGETDFTGELFDLIDRAYTPQDNFVSAFGKMLTHFLGEQGLVLFSPADPEVKRLARPFFRQTVELQEAVQRCLTRTNREIEEAGYHLQVEKSDDASHLFCNCDGRRPVKRLDGQFVVGDERVSKQDLLERIESEPELFSTDVMTRPVLQSWLFPVVSQKGGPAEIAYLAQNHRLFELFDRTPPFYMARPSATVMEARIAKLVHRYHIDYRELTGDIEQVINRVLAATFPANLEKGFEQLREDIEYHLNKFSNEALQFDPSLKKFTKQTLGKIDYLIKGFEGKVFSSHKRKSNETRDRIYRVYNALYTCRDLQERSLNILPFLSKYGRDFINWLYRELEGEEQNHQLLDMSDYQDQ